ncbi:MAG: GntR family transcriptional regulator [Ardenticatenaceae bacterium]|nr:GntR family transcriptional regulator [Ardenticatenaceae bacterium]HBY96422.1 hypothetical protein [Chloroflexota bacterium]
MDKAFLYSQIAESIRQEILQGTLQPGDRLPSIREMTDRWQCTPGTVQRAYQELARQGLVISRPGRGTHVAGTLSPEEESPLRRAMLVHQAERFLLESLTAGFSPTEVEQALHLALDRWRAVDYQPRSAPSHILRFAGSHDLALALIATWFGETAPREALEIRFVGSLAGLMALGRGEADLAGSHLWDEESDTYNLPFVRRLLPGERVAVLTLAHRRLGLMVPPGNPNAITTLADLPRRDLRFVNRQRGAGTRVWVEAVLRRAGVDPRSLPGHDLEMPTETDVARTVAEGRADVGPGIEAAARAYGLGFVSLTNERYDLIIPASTWERASVQALAVWLASGEAKAAIGALGGYDTAETGRIAWSE